MSAAPAIHEIDPELRRAVAQHWWYRAHAERQAAVRFDRLTERLGDVGAETVVIELCRRSGDDERRHAVLCAEMAERYDAEDPYRDWPTEAHEIAPPRLGFRERVLYETVAFCAVTESFNAGLLLACLRAAQDEMVRGAVRAILSDEVQHARLGWAHLTAERGIANFLALLLPRILEASLGEEALTRGPEEMEGGALPSHGHLAFADRMAAFESTLVEVVLPGFESLQMDTGPARAWAEGRGFGK